jgi:hypothetical protein
LLAVGGLPDLGPGPRAGMMPEKELSARLHSLMRDAKLSPNAAQLVRGLVLLWHDHMEPAHIIAQEIENADGSFLHGIVHRREPDYGNAAYWFQRVGSHPAFPNIAGEVFTFLTSRNRPDLQAELVPHREWDPFAFIRLCERAGDRSDGEGQTALLREIQGLESNALLEYWLNS